MKINAQDILQETYDVFIKAGFKEILDNSITISETDYYKLHTDFLVPTSIKIDTELFVDQVKEFKFQQWGKNHTHLPRYGLALVNKSGELIEDDPINGSLMTWNKDHPNDPIIETDCLKPTTVMNISSLNPLRIFDGYWTRSNILKWNNGAMFLPHIDTVVPSMWLRLWMSTEGLTVRYYDETLEELKEIEYEPGRVYLIDTSKIHDAYTTNDNVYQLFLSVLTTADYLISSVTLPTQS